MVTIRELAGGLSGGALGYITHGARGAIKGASAGYALARNKRKAEDDMAGNRKYVKTKHPYTKVNKLSKKYSLHRARNISGGGPHPYNKVGSNASAVKLKRKKGVEIKKRKRVRVSKLFEKKVKQALEAEDIEGTYLKVTYARMAAPASDTSQSVIDFANAFGPMEFVDAADVLFNDQVPVEAPTFPNNDWSNNWIRKDTVINSTMQLEMKNMSQRTYTLKIYTCQPKVVPTDAAPNDALADWSSGMIMSTAFGANPQSNSPSTLYCIPTDAPQFNRFWKAQCETVVLQPGQSHTYFLQGPNDYVLDYKKLQMKNIAAAPNWLIPYAKFTRNVFVVGHTDLVTSTLAGAGRFPSGGVGQGGIVFERRMFYKMKCPASAGFQYPTGVYPVGDTQQLDQKIPAKVIKFFPIGAAGTTEDVLEENPLSIINPAD